MIVNGKAIASDIYTDLALQRQGCAGRTIRFGLIMCSDDPVIASYVRMKEKTAEKLGITIVRYEIPQNATTAEAVLCVKDLSSLVDAVIVQLPLPTHIDTDAVLAAVPPEKDADALNPTVSGEGRFVHPPVARAVIEILQQGDVAVQNKKVVVVGAGRLVGAPVASMLQKLGAEVEVITAETGSLAALKDADIVVLGAGSPGVVMPDMIKEGCVLIDAGTSEQGGKVRGDADPACAEKAALFTPVPGGVGPVAIAMLFKNVLDLSGC